MKKNEYEGEDVARGAYICNSGERWLIINSDEQLNTTDRSSGTLSCRVAPGGSGAASQTPQGSNCLPQSQLVRVIANKLLMRSDSGTAYRAISLRSQLICHTLLDSSQESLAI